MARFSNTLIGLLNICSLLLSIAAVGASIYFHVHSGTACQRLLRNPLLILGICLFAVSLLGLIGSFFKMNGVLYLYLGLMLGLIVGIIVFTVFAFLVTNEHAGKAVSGKGYQEYRVGDFSHWLKKKFGNGKNWSRIKSCLIDMNVCKKVTKGEVKSAEEFYKKLSVVQAGCCKPPHSCGYQFRNATNWEVPKSGPAVDDKDCMTWNSNPKRLCYDCESCKGGVLASIRKEWRQLAIFNGSVIIFLIVVYSVGCCARKNNLTDKYLFYRPKSQP